MIDIRPIGDRVLVKREEAGAQTPGGIYLPDAAKEKPKQGKVLAVGDGRMIEATGERLVPAVKPDDVVIFASYAGTEIKVGNEEYIIMREEDILAIICEDDLVVVQQEDER